MALSHGAYHSTGCVIGFRSKLSRFVQKGNPARSRRDQPMGWDFFPTFVRTWEQLACFVLLLGMFEKLTEHRAEHRSDSTPQ